MLSMSPWRSAGQAHQRQMMQILLSNPDVGGARVVFDLITQAV